MLETRPFVGFDPFYDEESATLQRNGKLFLNVNLISKLVFDQTFDRIFN